jgi:hypothetical protein
MCLVKLFGGAGKTGMKMGLLGMINQCRGVEVVKRSLALMDEGSRQAKQGRGSRLRLKRVKGRESRNRGLDVKACESSQSDSQEQRNP